MSPRRLEPELGLHTLQESRVVGSLPVGHDLLRVCSCRVTQLVRSVCRGLIDDLFSNTFVTLHSRRSAMAGSMRQVRCAGNQQAAAATASRMIETKPNVSGSSGRI